MLRKTLMVAAALALIAVSCFFVIGQRIVSAPEITASTLDRSVILSARTFKANELVDVMIHGQNLFASTELILAEWQVMADGRGRVTTIWTPAPATGLVTVTMTGQKSGLKTSKRVTPPNDPAASSINLDQCRNGDINAPVNCTGTAWVNGNLNASQAHYMEGDSVPYRVAFAELDTSVTHTFTVEYDSTQGGHHALDYLTSFDRSESMASPCDLIPGCDPNVHTHFAIPIDAAVTAGADGISGTADDIAQAPGEFTLFGGNLISVSAYTVTGNTTGNSATSITVFFTANVPNPVLAWGAHIARRVDWGVGNSAIMISGSPFHTRVIEVDGQGVGNQDRGVASDAVYYPGDIMIIEDTRPHSPLKDFWYDANGYSLGGFWLDDDGEPAVHYPDTVGFYALTRFGTLNRYTFTQTNPSPYVVSQITCTSDPRGGAGTNDNIIDYVWNQVQITLQEGELVTCTFIHTLPTAANVSVSGRVMNSTGYGLRGARVYLSAPDGTVTIAIANSFGYYTFTQVAAGQDYMLTASARSYSFAPQFIVVTDTLTDVNIVASP
jgi:hypothetical protein